MEILGMLGQASIVALASMLVSVSPLFAGIAYAIRPSEQRLALMRPVSLAGLFAGLSGLMVGLINVLRGVWIHEPPVDYRVMAVGAAEAMVPLFLAFGSLTVAWLCVAFGFRRQT